MMIKDIESLKKSVHECVSEIASRWADQYHHEQKLFHKVLLDDQSKLASQGVLVEYTGSEELFTKLPTSSVYIWLYDMMVPHVATVLAQQENHEAFAKQWASVINNSQKSNIFDIIGQCHCVHDKEVVHHDHLHHQFHHLLMMHKNDVASHKAFVSSYKAYPPSSIPIEKDHQRFIHQADFRLNQLKRLSHNELHKEEEFIHAVHKLLNDHIPLAHQINESLSLAVEKAMGLPDTPQNTFSFKP